MKIIKGDLVLKKDTTFKEDIKVLGNIRCEGGLWNIDACNIDARKIDALKIDALNIDACDINAWNIDACNIDACNIDALNIDASDINASDIICIRRIKKTKDAKTIAYSITLDRFYRERKELMQEK
jgi:hypothetical protein